MNINQNVRDLSVAHLQLILCLLKCGNASVAAEQLGMSQSSVSYQLRRLRVMFEDELFLRTGSGLKPTERCQQIGFIAADLVVRIEEDLLHAGHFEPMAVRRDLSVVADGTITGWFAPLFLEFQKQMPRARLCARNWHLNSFQDLDKGEVHFGVHVMPADGAGVCEVEMDPCYRVFVVRKYHPLAQKGAVALEDLAMYPVLLHDLCGMNSHGNSLMERVMSDRDQKLNLVSKIGEVHSIFEMLRYSNAITYAAVASLPRDLSDFTLLKAPDCFSAIQGFYRLYVCRSRYGSQETNWLIEFLRDSFCRYIQLKHSRPELAGLIPDDARRLSTEASSAL
ncbi:MULTISPECIES: LysR family transcriptional regulator [Ferrimonas]|uniref:LysR family transcriptional regulator n=1 Tax=Ferrimonas TaxID=44011 RepID=UPI0004202B62|nr:MULTISPECIES: LysR family transcriptional regulator [Ferrimonas]USD37997.1 LysR family transcriptional regulator [Ferrimonas sp. SCSIO 43195]